MQKFEDIRIIDLDTTLSHNPNPEKQMYEIYLSLSASPPNGWVQIFNGERSFPRHTMWRQARVLGRHIIVDCPPDEIEKYHLHDLKQDINKANMKYRQFLTTQESIQAKEAAAKQAEDQDLENLRSRLNFDSDSPAK